MRLLLAEVQQYCHSYLWCLFAHKMNKSSGILVLLPVFWWQVGEQIGGSQLTPCGEQGRLQRQRNAWLAIGLVHRYLHPILGYSQHLKNPILTILMMKKFQTNFTIINDTNNCISGLLSYRPEPQRVQRFHNVTQRLGSCSLWFVFVVSLLLFRTCLCGWQTTRTIFLYMGKV